MAMTKNVTFGTNEDFFSIHLKHDLIKEKNLFLTSVVLNNIYVISKKLLLKIPAVQDGGCSENMTSLSLSLGFSREQLINCTNVKRRSLQLLYATVHATVL